MKNKKAACRMSSTTRARLKRPGVDNHSITDYERGSIWAAFAFIGMFVFLSIGCVLFGW